MLAGKDWKDFQSCLKKILLLSGDYLPKIDIVREEQGVLSKVISNRHTIQGVTPHSITLDPCLSVILLFYHKATMSCNLFSGVLCAIVFKF
jgi:hypothetical protein